MKYIPAGGDVPEWVAKLNQRLGMPANLSAMGVTKDRFDEFAAEAMHDSSHPSNPRPMQVADYKQVLVNAL